MLDTKERFYNIQIKLQTEGSWRVSHGLPGKRVAGYNDVVFTCMVDLESVAYKAFGATLTDLMQGHDEAMRGFFKDSEAASPFQRWP